MSRSNRDNQRRLDQQYQRKWAKNIYGRYDGRSNYMDENNIDTWASWGNKPWQMIVRYSQGRRQFYAGLKRLQRHLLKKNRMHDRLYGHHPYESE